MGKVVPLTPSQFEGVQRAVMSGDDLLLVDEKSGSCVVIGGGITGELLIDEEDTYEPSEPSDNIANSHMGGYPFD